MARKVDEAAANFVFVQLIVQKPGIYDKRHPDYTRQDKILNYIYITLHSIDLKLVKWLQNMEYI
jgi:hypothetical protein